MADLLGWTAERRQAELDAYDEHVRDVKGFLGEADADERPALRAYGRRRSWGLEGLGA